MQWAKPSPGHQVAWYEPKRCQTMHRQGKQQSHKDKDQVAFSKGSVIKNGKGQDSPSNGHV